MNQRGILFPRFESQALMTSDAPPSPDTTASLKEQETAPETALDPIAELILQALSDAEATNPGKPVSAEAISQFVASHRKKSTASKPATDAWRRYFQAVKDQIFFLARAGRVTVTKKGKPVASNTLKTLSGVWRVRMPRPDDFSNDNTS